MHVAHFREGSPSFSWLPDNRHIVVSLVTDENSLSHLWIADTASNDLTPLTTGPNRELFPVVSPDGKSILYDQDASHYDVVSVSVEDGTAKTLITTGHDEVMAAWAANQAKLAWVTDRSGPGEIWVRSLDGSDRPVVTAADFPAGTNKSFMNPSLSPDGDRLIYTRCRSCRRRASMDLIPLRRSANSAYQHRRRYQRGMGWFMVA